MSALLWNGLPVAIGILCGLAFTWQVNAVLGTAAAVVAGWMLWTTRDAEIGALVGVIAAILAGLFIVSLGITTALAYGVFSAPNLSWLLRGAP